MAMLVGAVPLVFEGLSIVLPAAIGLAAAGALAGSLSRAPGSLSRAPPITVSTYRGSGGGSSRDPPRSPDMNRAKELAMKMMLAKMLADALEKKKNSDPPERWCRAAGVLAQGMTRDVLRLKDKHEWCGHFLSGPASENKGEDEVVHQGIPPKGSKAGVAYQANGYQWVVAWHVPIRTTPHDQNKIYVEHGPVAQIDWNLVEKKLDASNNKCMCPGAMAEITDGNDAILAVIFCQ